MLGQTYNLVSEYQQIFSGSEEFNSWSKFVVSNHHIFAITPDLVYQQVFKILIITIITINHYNAGS